ncbi:type IV secretion system protein [Bacillus sp. NP157]|nr:type IV secretion system protein [Bacillus sp. NP157]
MVDLISIFSGSSAVALAGPLDSATQFVFFTTINNFLRDEIDVVQWNLLSRSAYIVGYIATVVLTVWIIFQGWRIVSGQSRQPMMALVGDALKATLIVFIASTAAYASSSVYWTLSDGLATNIASYVTGENNTTPFEQIDRNLAGMELAMGTIDSLDTGGNQAIQDAKDRNRWFTGIGIAGPSVIAGAMLLLNKIALALFVGFGPLFILCLLFEQTKSLFQKWLLYGIGTVFSLAVLSIMVTIAMKMMAAVTAAFIAKYLISFPGLGISPNSTDGINSMALQQGGLGLLLTTMIISAPPMAATFFQGTLGQFSAYSPFGRIQPEKSGGGGAGYPGQYPSAPSSSQDANRQNNVQNPQPSSANLDAIAGNRNSYAPLSDQTKQRDPKFDA